MKKIFLINNIKFLITLTVVCGLSFSCKKWIEIPPPKDRTTPEFIFSDSASAMVAIAGVYHNFGYHNYKVAINGSDISIYPALSSDELLTSSTDLNTNQFVENSLRPENTTASRFWNTGYEGIYRVNATIKGISESKGIREELKQRLIGEMKVARALYYFHLANLYGAVPLVSTTDYTVNATLPRASENEVYQLIIADLTDARQSLQAAYPSAGRARPNLYTATALLAKVYLYQQNWAGVEMMANEIVNSGLYSLEGDPNNVFLAGSAEAIWQLPTTGNRNGQTNEGAFGFFVPFSATVIPEYYLTQTLLNAFEIGDQRNIKWLKSNTIGANTYTYPFKYKKSTATDTPREDYVLFRLAEQYLILAEALARQNKLTEALPYLNQIRSRAGLPDIFPATQTDVLDAIMQERRVELFCERGNRWFDLKRTGTANAILGALKPTTWQPEDALYPVPYSELLYNPYLAQNPGY